MRRAVWDVKLYDRCRLRPSAEAKASAYLSDRAHAVLLVEERPSGWPDAGASPSTGSRFEAFLPAGLTDPTRRRSALARPFVAGLQLSKDGSVELRQPERFGPTICVNGPSQR